MLLLRKNTAGQRVFFGLVNASTGAAITGATVTAQRAIDGAAQAAITGTITEIGGGQYRADLSQADTNGDFIGLLFTATNAMPVSRFARTTNADLLDGVRLGLTALPNANAGASGGLPTGNASGQVTVAALTSNALDSVALATSAADEIATAVWSAASRSLTDKAGFSLATDGLSAAALSAGAGTKVADIVLRRSFAAAEASSDGDTLGARSLLGAGSKLTNRVRVNSGKLQIYRANDTTLFFEQNLTSDPAAEPIVEVDTV